MAFYAIPEEFGATSLLQLCAYALIFGLAWTTTIVVRALFFPIVSVFNVLGKLGIPNIAASAENYIRDQMNKNLKYYRENMVAALQGVMSATQNIAQGA